MPLLGHGLDGEGAVAQALRSWTGDPVADALALRLAGGLHALVLSGRAPDLAAVYPGGARAGDVAALRAAVLASLDEQAAFLCAFLEGPPQTNEVGRSAALLGGFLTVAAETGRPLSLLEIGASAGLNLLWDHYGYRLGAAGWGPEDAAVTLAPEWRGDLPPLGPVEVAARRGCDRAPVDPRDRLRLLAYVWADQATRRRRLEAALAQAARLGLTVEAADAGDWTRRQLETPAAGQATVLYHSIVWQYLPAASRRAVVAAVRRAAGQANTEAPFAWLRMEPLPGADCAAVTLTLWPGGRERRLARADYHGRWVDWLGSR
jgi:hypothetical protein